MAATEEKTALEEAQRAAAKERKMKCLEWIPKYFEQVPYVCFDVLTILLIDMWGMNRRYKTCLTCWLPYIVLVTAKQFASLPWWLLLSPVQSLPHYHGGYWCLLFNAWLCFLSMALHLYITCKLQRSVSAETSSASQCLWQFTVLWKWYVVQHSSLGKNCIQIMTHNVQRLKHVNLNASMTCTKKLDAYTDTQGKYSVHEWVLDIHYQRKS